MSQLNNTIGIEKQIFKCSYKGKFNDRKEIALGISPDLPIPPTPQPLRLRGQDSSPETYHPQSSFSPLLLVSLVTVLKSPLQASIQPEPFNLLVR